MLRNQPRNEGGPRRPAGWVESSVELSEAEQPAVPLVAESKQTKTLISCISDYLEANDTYGRSLSQSLDAEGHAGVHLRNVREKLRAWFMIHSDAAVASDPQLARVLDTHLRLERQRDAAGREFAAGLMKHPDFEAVIVAANESIERLRVLARDRGAMA